MKKIKYISKTSQRIVPATPHWVMYYTSAVVYNFYVQLYICGPFLLRCESVNLHRPAHHASSEQPRHQPPALWRHLVCQHPLVTNQPRVEWHWAARRRLDWPVSLLPSRYVKQDGCRVWRWHFGLCPDVNANYWGGIKYWELFYNANLCCDTLSHGCKSILVIITPICTKHWHGDW